MGSSAAFAQLVAVFALQAGYAGFLQVRRPFADRIDTIERKASLRIVQNADITFDGVFVPRKNVLRARPTDFRLGSGLPAVLEASRILVAWLPVGVCMGAYDLTLRYLRERRQL